MTATATTSLECGQAGTQSVLHRKLLQMFLLHSQAAVLVGLAGAGLLRVHGALLYEDVSGRMIRRSRDCRRTDDRISWRQPWLRKQNYALPRVASVACSTGEDFYRNSFFP